jgi:hypothetical protein
LCGSQALILNVDVLLSVMMMMMIMMINQSINQWDTGLVTDMVPSKT